MTKILSLDTSGRNCFVCLDIDGRLLSREHCQDRAHARTLLSLVGQLLEEAGCTLGQLDALAVVSGPGSFTGLRIGTGVVQGLAMASALPVVLLSSLAVLAQSGYAEYGYPMQLVALKSQNSEIFFAAYRLDTSGVVKLSGSELVFTSSQYATDSIRAEKRDILAIGDGWEYLASMADGIGLPPAQIATNAQPQISAMAILARHGYTSSALVEAELVLPNYLKDELDYRRAE